MAPATFRADASARMATEIRRDRAVVAFRPRDSASTPTAVSTSAQPSSGWSGVSPSRYTITTVADWTTSDA